MLYHHRLRNQTRQPIICIEESRKAPRVFLDYFSFHVGVSCVEKLWIAESIRNIWSSEFGHLFKFTELAAELDVGHILETAIAVYCHTKPNRLIVSTPAFGAVHVLQNSQILSGYDILDDVFGDGLTEVNTFDSYSNRPCICFFENLREELLILTPHRRLGGWACR